MTSFRVHAALAAAIAVLMGTPLLAAPPPPGGSDEMKAVPGTFGAWAFNGRWRLKLSFIGDPHLKSYWPYEPREGNHIIVVRGMLRNGMSQAAKTVFSVFVSDADGVAYQGQSLFAGNPAVAPKFGDVILPPGAATPMQFPIEVPIGFVPAKLLIVPSFSELRPMRIDLTKVVKKAL
jgi:hypothetical protein